MMNEYLKNLIGSTYIYIIKITVNNDLNITKHAHFYMIKP